VATGGDRSHDTVMMLDEAMEWLAANGGKVHLVRRTEAHNYYQIVIYPHRSIMIGVEHHGCVDVEPTEPDFERAFVALAEDIRSKVDAPQRVSL
jgi:hypothetical protein